jgi:hypothetical protein
MSLGDSLLTNAGSSLEMVLKGFCETADVWGSSFGLGAKN